GATAGIMIPWGTACGGNRIQSDRFGDVLPLRRLGKTGKDVTMLGLGGYHIGWTTEKHAQDVIETAISGGIRFFDTAHSYEKGTSEERYGRFLIPQYRDQIFLMTKSTARNGVSIQKEFDLSLKRMQCDYVDLLQIHSLESPDDVDQRLENGVVDASLKILSTGKAKYIGFTGHRNPYAHVRMMEQLPDSHSFSTVQMPVNLVDYASEHSFVKQVIPKALENDLGILAMKTLADGRFFNRKESKGEVKWTTDSPVIPDHLSVKEALYFSWSMPISVLITGAENAILLKEKIELAKEFVSMSEADRSALLAKVEQAPDREGIEYYKKIEG
ncbi:MAG: aldo/keto reductase, partial [Bacteroidales bacterium]|nr:aldo/keto reductase [Bacteroidales bacterium]